jgi:hypothetical protein
MRYYRAKKTLENNTTINIIPVNNEKIIFYDYIDGYEYVSVESEDYNNFEINQNPLCELAQLQYEEIKEVLINCHIYKDINKQVKDKIRTLYDEGDEISMLYEDNSSEKFIKYRNHVEECKIWGNEQKTKLGLKQ